MTSNDAGTATDSANTPDDNTASADITQPDDKPQEAEQQGPDKSAPLVEQDKQSMVRRLTGKTHVLVPHQQKGRWGALSASVVAATGLVAGWAIRRRRRDKPFWRRRPR